VSGYLGFPDGSSPAGAPLAVEYQTAGAAWTQIASARCAVDGGWRATVTLPATGLVRAVFPGDGVRPRVESLPIRVEIIPRLSLGLDDDRPSHGDVVEITGTVDPSQRVKLLLHRRVGRRWKRERKRKLRAVDGAFGVRLRPRRRGRYRVTVKAGGVRRRRHLRVG
jgi:hypothetical protein